MVPHDFIPWFCTIVLRLVPVRTNCTVVPCVANREEMRGVAVFYCRIVKPDSNLHARAYGISEIPEGVIDSSGVSVFPKRP